MPPHTRQATVDDIDRLVPLFDAYRQFYRLPSDPAAARRFLLDRFQHNQSVIFLAFQDAGGPIGFTQLYPSFSSGAMARIFILNDLFVIENERRRGAATALLDAAARYAKAVGAVRLVLSTELANTTAQAVYQRRGWQRDAVFCVYTMPIPVE